jgi:PAS domain S-box-containing protein
LRERAERSERIREMRKNSRTKPIEVVKPPMDEEPAFDALEVTEERFRAFVENALDIISIFDAEGRIIYESPSVKDILGYEQDELLGRYVIDLIHPEDRDKVLPHLTAMAERPDHETFIEERFLHKDGSWHYFESTGRSIFEGGKLKEIMVISRDITERKEAEEAPRRSEEYLRSLIENTLDIIAIIEPDGTLTYNSPSVKTVLGYEEDEKLGTDVLELVHPDDLGDAVGAIQEMVTDPKTVASLQWRFLDKQGSWRVLDGLGKVLPGPEGMRGIIINCRDITERRQVEEELEKHREHLEEMVAERTRELENINERLQREIDQRVQVEKELAAREGLYRLLAENIVDIIWTTDLDLNTTYISPSIEWARGYTVEEAMARPLDQNLTPESLETVQAIFAEAIQSLEAGELDLDSVWNLEVETYCKDGSTVWVEFTISIIRDDEGQPTGLLGVSRDINKRKQAEEALKESEEMFRFISEQSLLGILILQDGLIKYGNQAMVDIYEFPLRESMAWAPDEHAKTIHPDDRDFVMEQARIKQEGGEGRKTSYKARIITKSGKQKWVEIFSKSVLFRGRPADMITMVDISDRVHMEEESKTREERFRSLIENALDVILVVDEKGTVKYVSPSVEKVLGFTPEEITDKVGFEFIHPHQLQTSAETLGKIIENPGEVVPFELRVRHKDGSWRDISVTARNFMEDPSVKGIIINYRDITASKVVTERLERINHLFLNLGVDLIENMDRIVEACRDILGISLAAYCRIEKGRFTILSTARGEESFIVTDSPEDFVAYRPILKNLEEPLIVEDLDTVPYGDKDPFVVKNGFRSFLGYPVRKRNKAIGCLFVFDAEPRKFLHQDIEILGNLSRALEVEEERFANEQSLKDFVDVASHELRHPITLMKGYALTLRNYGDRLDDEMKSDYLGIISEGADRLDMLIKELLDASRIERGRFDLHRLDEDLQPLLERAVSEMAGKGVAHQIKLDIKEPLSTRAVDGEKLLRVLVILLDNATAHSPANFPIEVTAEDTVEGCRISVADRGVGIPESDRQLIFERFYQVEDALHHTTRGMGLGLYIAKEVVEIHGGMIWHEHNPGGGSIFRFVIP